MQAPVVASVPPDAPPPSPADAAPPDAPVAAPMKTPVAAHKEPGLFSIESSPYATIFVDGHKLGITPILKHALPAGHHRIRAVLQDGRSKELGLDVPAGKQAAPINLSW